MMDFEILQCILLIIGFQVFDKDMIISWVIVGGKFEVVG